MENFKNHTFVICAYKESKYLEECIKSLLAQTVKSNIIIATSTPNDHIKKLSEKYNLGLFINKEKPGIGTDWNYGVFVTDTDYVTVAHQDDIYKENYLEEIVKELNKKKDFIIAFTKYKEIKNNKEIDLTINLKIKEAMLWPLKIFSKSKWIRRRILSFGCAICCPSVTINKKIVGNRPYKTELKCNLDWDTWVDFTKYNGRFLYIPKYLMCHRIHEKSETSNLIENNIRLEEDFYMFNRFWPKSISKILVSHYKNAIKTNEIKKND